MAYNKVGSATIGFTPNAPANGIASQAINATATWLGLSFIAKASNFNEVTAYCVLSGTLAAADVTCSLCSDSSGVPNSGSPLETKNCSTTPATGFLTWNGFTTSLTAGTRYHLVFKNLNGTPATNFLTFRYPSNGTYPLPQASSIITWGWSKRHSNDSGGTWTAANVVGVATCLVGYDTAGTPTYDGFALNTLGTNSVNIVYSTRELGVRFTTPATGKFVVSGISFFIFRNGTPTGNLRYRIYQGTTLVATTYEMPVTGLANGNAAWIPLALATNVTLENNTSYRVVISEATNSDTSSNYWSNYRYTILNSSANLSTLPFNGTLTETYYNGTSWAEDAQYLCAFGLHLDVSAEIESSGGGGGSTFIYNLME